MIPHAGKDMWHRWRLERRRPTSDHAYDGDFNDHSDPRMPILSITSCNASRARMKSPARSWF